MIKSEAIKILHEVEKHQGFVIFIQCFRWKLKCTEEETCIECESKNKRRQKQELDISARQTAGTVFARYNLVPKIQHFSIKAHRPLFSCWLQNFKKR
jgi:hypothetical protein